MQVQVLVLKLLVHFSHLLERLEKVVVDEQVKSLRLAQVQSSLHDGIQLEYREAPLDQKLIFFESLEPALVVGSDDDWDLVWVALQDNLGLFLIHYNRIQFLSDWYRSIDYLDRALSSLKGRPLIIQCSQGCSMDQATATEGLFDSSASRSTKTLVSWWSLLISENCLRRWSRISFFILLLQKSQIDQEERRVPISRMTMPLPKASLPPLSRTSTSQIFFLLSYSIYLGASYSLTYVAASTLLQHLLHADRVGPGKAVDQFDLLETVSLQQYVLRVDISHFDALLLEVLGREEQDVKNSPELMRLEVLTLQTSLLNFVLQVIQKLIKLDGYQFVLGADHSRNATFERVVHREIQKTILERTAFFQTFLELESLEFVDNRDGCLDDWLVLESEPGDVAQGGMSDRGVRCFISHYKVLTLLREVRSRTAELSWAESLPCSPLSRRPSRLGSLPAPSLPETWCPPPPPNRRSPLHSPAGTRRTPCGPCCCQTSNRFKGCQCNARGRYFLCEDKQHHPRLLLSPSQSVSFSQLQSP